MEQKDIEDKEAEDVLTFAALGIIGVEKNLTTGELSVGLNASIAGALIFGGEATAKVVLRFP